MSVDLTIPDIGNFADVDVVDVLVKPGDLIARLDPGDALREDDELRLELPAGVDVQIRLN